MESYQFHGIMLNVIFVIRYGIIKFFVESQHLNGMLLVFIECQSCYYEIRMNSKNSCEFTGIFSDAQESLGIHGIS